MVAHTVLILGARGRRMMSLTANVLSQERKSKRQINALIRPFVVPVL